MTRPEIAGSIHPVECGPPQHLWQAVFDEADDGWLVLDQAFGLQHVNTASAG